jgi:hypothetical protein
MAMASAIAETIRLVSPFDLFIEFLFYDSLTIISVDPEPPVWKAVLVVVPIDAIA